MTDTIEQLYSRWLESKTEELQRAAQQLIQSEDPEAAFREALNQPTEPTDLMEAFSDRMTPEPDRDGPFIPELNRRISREEAQTLLTRWNQPVSPFVPLGSAGEAMADALNAAGEQWQAEQARRQEERQATHDENVRSGNANRTSS